MVAITAVASYALLEIDMGQVGDQLRENGSTDIHPPLFRQRRNGPRSDFRPFSIQIVFSSKAGYPADYKSLTGLCKVLYRTPVICSFRWAGILSVSTAQWQQSDNQRAITGGASQAL
jgi:hypothetical protein